MGYDLLADLIVAFHFAYIAFILIGQAAILVGAAVRWSWIRNFWCRAVHLLAMALVGIEAIFNIDCPLTVWESRLRTLAGHETAEGSFISRWLHYVIFYEVDNAILQWLHIGVAILIVGTFVFIPPRWPWRHAAEPRLAVRQQSGK